MRKALYAGISAFALALAFGGSSAWANPFEESVNAHVWIGWATNAACDNCGNKSDDGSNTNTNANQVNDTSLTNSHITQNRNETVFSSVKVTKIVATQTLNQHVSHNDVDINAYGGRGGNANGGSASAEDATAKAWANGTGGKGGKGGTGGETEAENANATNTNSSSGTPDQDATAKNFNSGRAGNGGAGGKGGDGEGGEAAASAASVASSRGGTGGGGGGGGTIVAGNVTSIVAQSAGLFNQQFATLSSGAQGGVNFSAFAINSFNTR